MPAFTLLGREHHGLGEIVVCTEEPAALAISLGGAPKVYAHTDPNEDAALLVQGGGGRLLAVADGHGGAEAAEIAIARLAEQGERWTQADWRCADWNAEAIALLTLANGAIREASARGGRRLCRTTLAFALVRPADGTIRFASIGDSHIFHVTPEGALDLARAHPHDAGRPPEGGTFFLGFTDETPDSMAGKCHVSDEPLPRTRALVLATDGLSERGVGVDEPEDVVTAAVAATADAADGRGAHLAHAVATAATDAHRRRRSGDNVAVAALWLEDGDAAFRPAGR